ncbi:MULTISPECIES: class I SAM-dependent methyltransferase [unclassified Mesorhizobium]|uniref:class I SAM-dependent methyltransferase n=1 Tax=unclassified Mesorhizobium TaxID=325217 RepID=UPI00163DA66E|nr:MULTISPECIES: class I SAM-dependent methyltransferase [unclassified Mesorhizobium]
MRFAIDSVRQLLGSLVVVIGWSETGRPVLLVNGTEHQGASVPMPRPDVVDVFGESAREWSWMATFHVPESIDLADGTAVAIRDGEQLHIVELTTLPVEQQMQPSSIFADFMQIIQDTQEGRAILEIGSRARSGISRRDMFEPKLKYVGLDIMAGPNVDVVGDAHSMPVELNNRFDFAFSASTFEHLLMPWKAALELNRALKPGGIAYIQSHQTWPVHEEPWDFFRFSKYAWTGLFNVHTGFEMVRADHWHNASVIPRLPIGAPLKGLGDQPAFMLSACIVRKIGDPLVIWAGNPAEITDLNYDHALPVAAA